MWEIILIMKKLLLIIGMFLAPALLSSFVTDAAEIVTPQPDNDGIVVKTRSGGLEISVQSEHTVTFHIYSVTGQLVRTVKIADSSESIDLPPGYYIVKCDRWSHRYLVS